MFLCSPDNFFFFRSPPVLSSVSIFGDIFFFLANRPCPWLPHYPLGLPRKFGLHRDSPSRTGWSSCSIKPRAAMRLWFFSTPGQMMRCLSLVGSLRKCCVVSHFARWCQLTSALAFGLVQLPSFDWFGPFLYPSGSALFSFVLN